MKTENWKALERYTDTLAIPIGMLRDDGAYSIVAEVAFSGGVVGESDADARARIIAAAPDLLRALEICRDAMKKHAPNSDQECNLADVMASNAIAKATNTR